MVKSFLLAKIEILEELVYQLDVELEETGPGLPSIRAFELKNSIREAQEAVRDLILMFIGTTDPVTLGEMDLATDVLSYADRMILEGFSHEG